MGKKNSGKRGLGFNDVQILAKIKKIMNEIDTSEEYLANMSMSFLYQKDKDTMIQAQKLLDKAFIKLTVIENRLVKHKSELIGKLEF